MSSLPDSLKSHRITATELDSVINGVVRYSPHKSLWLLGMTAGAVMGGALTFSWVAFGVFVLTTGAVLLLGHSLGSHRKLIHDSYQCPKWLEYTLVYCGVQVGLAGPLGLLRQHDLRDYAQRLPDCHDYLRHGRTFWRDGWWQLHCELQLDHEPSLLLEPRIANDRFYQFLEHTWMLQQLPPALLLYAFGGWGFVFWGVCARVTAGVCGHWLIGYFAHNHGGMHYEVRGAAVQGRNIRFTSLLTMGESWHNNHHAYPGSAKLGLVAGEWDPGWWMLMLLERAGLVWDIKLPDQLAMRAELVALDQVCKGLRPDSLYPPLTLAELWAQYRQSPDQPVLAISGPAANVSARFLQRLLGSAAHFTQLNSARRLQLRIANRTVQGLPAISIALARRHFLLRCLLILLGPITLGIERLRYELQLA
ncbi:acyl-CoA desaturase [Chitinimonas naiadis]